jgi:hypothetical protein
MPRFNPALLQSVFFLFAKDTRTGKEGEFLGPYGTGVIVGLATTRPQSTHFYAVTARHVHQKTGAYLIRINTRNGKSAHIDVDPNDWVSEPTGPDLAAADITEEMRRRNHDFSYFPADMFCTRDFIAKRDVTIGEDGFMLGLFHDLPGKERNLIAARFGNIALMADEAAKVKLPGGNYFPAHLFDIRSRPGFSGSPVCIYRVPTSDLINAEGPYVISGNDRFLRLLGIHVSQYNDYVDQVRVEQKPGEEPQYFKTEQKFSIPNSVTVVVPAWEIEILLRNKRLKEQRKARDMADDR